MPRNFGKREDKTPGRESRDRLKARFLLHFKATRGKVFVSAARTGIHHNTVWEWRKQDETFAKAYDALLEQGTDEMELEAERRAMHKNGRHDGLMQFMLRSRRKDKYSDPKPAPGGDPPERKAGPDMSGLSKEDLERIARMESKE